MSLTKIISLTRSIVSLAEVKPSLGLPIRPDKIRPKGCVFFGYHGDFTAYLPEEERALGAALLKDQKIRQKYVVDAAVYCNLVAAGSSDDVKDVPSHTAIYRYMRQVMEGPPRKRLETAVHDVIVGVLAEHLNVAGMRISVHRLYAPVGGALHSQGVALERFRADREDV